MATYHHRYLNAVERAVALMQSSLANEVTPSLEQLAGAACLSRFHFHRIYRLLTGETCQQTLTRLKLAKAAAGIQANQQNITDIAFDAGYGSSQALAKALKRHTSTSASQLRKDPERLTDTIAFLSRPDDTSQAAISVELVSLQPMTLMAIHTQRPYPELNQVYEQLFIAAGGPQNVAAILGIPGPDGACLDNEGNTFDCALLLSEALQSLPEPCIHKQVNGAPCVRIRHQGSFSNLDDSIDRLYHLVLAQQEVSIADQPCLFHYLDDPEEVEEAFLRTDIYLPVTAVS